MTDELKQLIEDAAKLLELPNREWCEINNCVIYATKPSFPFKNLLFNPLDPERGDLMKVAEAAGLCIDHKDCAVSTPCSEIDESYELFDFIKGDHDSLALAILRAASAVWQARGGE